MSIGIEVKNLGRLQKIADRYPAIAQRHIGKAIARSLARVLGEEKRQAPFGVTGNLRDNWSITTPPFEGTLKSNAPYASAVNFGQAPNPFPTAEQLRVWATKKGLNPYAVAKAIRKRGHLIANPFFNRAIDDAEKGVQQDFDEAMKNILAEV